MILSKAKGDIRWPVMILTAAICLFFFYLIRFSMTSLADFSCKGRDLMTFCQSINSAAHGSLLRNTMESLHLFTFLAEDKIPALLEAGGISHLSHHWSPILFVLAPLYRLIPDALLLQIIHVLALSLGCVPLYLFACRKMHHQEPATVLALGYLAQPLILFLATLNFRENSLGAPLLGLLFYAALRERKTLYWFALGAALLVKEDMALVTLIFGIGLLIKKRFRQGAITVAISALWIPIAMYGMQLLSYGYPNVHLRRYHQFGRSMGEIAMTILSSPMKTLRLIWTRMEPGYFWVLLGPWLFLPLLSPYCLLAVPVLLLNLLSSQKLQHYVMNYANMPLVPIFAFGAADGLSRLLRFRSLSHLGSRGRRLLAAGLAAGIMLTVACVLSSYPPLGKKQLGAPLTIKEQLAAREFIAKIPRSASVMASPRFLPALCNHPMAVPPCHIPGYKPDYLLIYADETFVWPQKSFKARDRLLHRLASKGYRKTSYARVHLFVKNNG